MSVTQLFLKTVDAYKTWVSTGMNHKVYSDLYEAWDEALLSYAEAMSITRKEATLHVYEAIRLENKR